MLGCFFVQKPKLLTHSALPVWAHHQTTIKYQNEPLIFFLHSVHLLWYMKTRALSQEKSG